TGTDSISTGANQCAARRAVCHIESPIQMMRYPRRCCLFAALNGGHSSATSRKTFAQQQEFPSKRGKRRNSALWLEPIGPYLHLTNGSFIVRNGKEHGWPLPPHKKESSGAQCCASKGDEDETEQNIPDFLPAWSGTPIGR